MDNVDTMPKFRLPPRRASLSDLVADALLVAFAGIRQRMKNLIILRTLRDGVDFDQTWFTETVRAEAEHLAVESEQDAQRLLVDIGYARKRHRSAVTARDYNSRDVPLLRRRRRVLLAVAKSLRDFQTDDEATAKLIDEARMLALDEIAATAASVPQKRGSRTLKGVARSIALQDLREELEELLDMPHGLE